MSKRKMLTKQFQEENISGEQTSDDDDPEKQVTLQFLKKTKPILLMVKDSKGDHEKLAVHRIHLLP